MCQAVKRVVSLFILSAVMLSGVSGCQKTEPPPSAPSFSDAQLRVVTTYGPNNGGHQAFQRLCDQFEEDTGAEVINDAADSTEEWKQSVLASYENGTEPDILFFFIGPDANKMIDNDHFVSIGEIRDSYPDYATNINLSVLENLKAPNGEGYAVPVKGYWERLFVNADLFTALALPLPENYEDLFTLAPRLLDAGIIPMAASLKEVPHYLFEYYLFNVMGPANHYIAPSDPNYTQQWVSALDQFAQMYNAGMFPDENDAPTHADALELFQSKKAAMILDGDWSVAYIRDTENVIVIDFPATIDGPRKNTDLISGFSMGFYISKKTWDDPEKRDAAVEFVQFVTSNESITWLNVSGAAMPIITSAGSDTTQAGTSPDDAAANDVTPLRKSIDELNAKTTAFVSATADEFPIEIRSWLFSRILPLAKGEVSSADLLQELNAKINEG